MAEIIEGVPEGRFFVAPIFIVGMPRSGTKLLRELLNRHHRIFINDIETEFLPYLVSHWPNFGDVSDIEHFRDFYAHIKKLPYFIYRMDMGSLVTAESWHAACREYTPAGVFEALVRLDTHVSLGSDRIWGDKSPSYVHHLKLIKTLYPDARIIHIIRDVRDYCLSINKAWGKNMLRAAQRWAEGVDAACRAGAELGGDYLDLRYEDLLADNESALRRICTFLGIDFEPVMLSLDKPSENIGDARGATCVLSGNQNKFIKAMSPHMLGRIEAIAGEILTDCGYGLTQPPQKRIRLSVTTMRIAQLHDAWNLFRFGLQKRGIWGSVRFYFRYFTVTRGGGS
ncbi:MAG: sulfotransferase family protein [Gammaproteobacteria bacterium]